VPKESPLPQQPKAAPVQHRVAPAPKPSQQQKTAPTRSAAPTSSTSAPTINAPPAATDTVKEACKLEKKFNFIEARQKCELALSMSAGMPSAILCLARMAKRAGNTVGEVTKILKKKDSSVLSTPPWCIEALSIRASVAQAFEDWSAAAEDLEKAVKASQAYQGKHDGPSLVDLKGRLSKALWYNDDREEAIQIAQSLIDSGDVGQKEANEVAINVLFQKGDPNTAMGVMLRCLIAHRNDSSKENADLVCGTMKQSSVEHLLHVLAPNFKDGGPESVEKESRNSIAEVLSYVGLIMKERSEIVPACRLYRIGVSLAPEHSSLCLNLMHTYSLREDNIRALAFGVEHFGVLKDKNPAALIVWSLLKQPGAGGAESSVAFEEKQFDSKNSFYDTMAIGFTLVKLLFLSQPFRLNQGAVEAPENADTHQAPWQKCLLGLDVRKEKPLAKQTVLRCHWTQDAADIHAHRSIVQGLCQVLDRSRQGLDLHTTPVRNEHAYFACANDILQCPSEKPRENVREAPGSHIYVVGDSHVLSSGWQTVYLPAEGDTLAAHTLVPTLVTGVKIWHLKKNSTFYTKSAFWERISSIPNGAPVIFVLGEIDCREGVLKAVYLGRHSSVEAALSGVIDLYMTVLEEVRKKLPKSPIFIHPVANVIVDTRFMTMPFNKLLAQRQAKFQKIGVKVLAMASVFEGGADLSPDASNDELKKLVLLSSLQLDGTHMNPSYVQTHLNPALASVWP
jgi:hypothetical protein